MRPERSRSRRRPWSSVPRCDTGDRRGPRRTVSVRARGAPPLKCRFTREHERPACARTCLRADGARQHRPGTGGDDDNVPVVPAMVVPAARCARWGRPVLLPSSAVISRTGGPVQGQENLRSASRTAECAEPYGCAVYREAGAPSLMIVPLVRRYLMYATADSKDDTARFLSSTAAI